MVVLPRTETRLRRIRLFGWVLAPAIAFPMSWILAMVRAPDAPTWLRLVIALVGTVVAGALLSHTLVRATEDLLVARLGTEAERQRRIAEPPSRFAQGAARAALAFEAGAVTHAQALMASLRPADLRHALGVVVAHRRALAVGDRAARDLAIDSLLVWRAGPRLGLRAEIARYHAFVLASAFDDARSPGDPRVVESVRRLRSDRDVEVRAYATWLPAASYDEVDADPLLTGAALARASGREPLAQALELRAARIAGNDQTPYRAG